MISIHALREEGDNKRAYERGLLIYFNPRPPRGGRHWCAAIDEKTVLISIHALREEGDISLSQDSELIRISIHALREEGDRRQGRYMGAHRHFNPRPPRGGRLLSFPLRGCYD